MHLSGILHTGCILQSSSQTILFRLLAGQENLRVFMCDRQIEQSKWSISHGARGSSQTLILDRCYPGGEAPRRTKTTYLTFLLLVRLADKRPIWSGHPQCGSKRQRKYTDDGLTNVLPDGTVHKTRQRLQNWWNITRTYGLLCSKERVPPIEPGLNGLY